MDSTLVLVRHGESEWNKLNLFTGWKDVDLTEQGVAEAHRAGRLMHAQGMKFDIAYTSLLKRANRTLEIILSELGQADLQTIRDEALNERDYGELTGLNKDDARERWGEEQVLIWRRSFDIPPPGGESLKGTAARVLPYFDAHIKPQLDAGKSIIVAAHGNSLRALLMQLEQLTPEEILKVNIATGAPLVYRLGSGGAMIEKRELVA
ncbi:MAG: 2,3-bisphosphoglycerate-dependent phosphoglycerate mutase [Chitinophagales bacterium]|nr:2,3-bisphosphoglycerate-dependent phosphoglycerate mutase [Hyphomicrobiales bacterium]